MIDLSAALISDANARAAAAESRAVSAEAKAGVAQNERDVAVKTAEAADAINQRLVGRIDEVSRQAGRLEGVNEVLKDKLRQNLDAPPAPQVAVPDQKPTLDALNRIEKKLEERPAVQPTVVEATARPAWRERYRESFGGLLRPIIWIPGLVIVVLILLAIMAGLNHGKPALPPAYIPTSSSSQEIVSSSSEEPSSVVVQPEHECTLTAAVYADGVGCVFPVPGE